MFVATSYDSALQKNDHFLPLIGYPADFADLNAPGKQGGTCWFFTILHENKWKVTKLNILTFYAYKIY